MTGAARLFAEPFRNTDADWAKGLGFGIAGVFAGNDRDENQSSLNFRTPGRATFFKYATSSDVSVVSDGTQRQIAPQLYYYWGPFGLMGEYISSYQDLRRIDDSTGSITTGDVWNTGWFVQASYVLTGEDASYKTVVPINNFDPWQGRWGAFEIAARGSMVEIDDNAFRDGFADLDSATPKASQFSLGVNWYFNKNFKFQLNYDHTAFDGELDFGKGPVDHESVVLAQFQISY
jgi:phosphate-selective porin OprO/OprP